MARQRPKTCVDNCLHLNGFVLAICGAVYSTAGFIIDISQSPESSSRGVFSNKMRSTFLAGSCRRRCKGFALLVFLIVVCTVAHFTLQNRASSVLAILGDFFWLDLFHSKYFIPRNSIIMPQHISYLIQPERSCRSEAYIAVLIPSHPKDGLTRTTIRKTWGHALIQNQWPHAKLGAHADIFFLLGRASSELEHQSVEQEAHTNADMIIGDFADTYRNLSIKMLFGLNWIAKNCADTKFLVKVDQDTFVNFPQLMDLLLNNEHKLHNSVLGKLYYSPWVLGSGKWKNDPNEYPFSMFPTYAGGPCYILSTDITAQIVNMSQYMPYMSLEDVYITGVLSKALGARKYYIPQLHNFPEEETFCDFIVEEKELLSSTQLSTNQLRELWQTITRGTC